MNKIIIFTFLFLLSCQSTIDQTEVKEAIVVSDSNKLKPVAITKVVGKIPRGTVIGSTGFGMFCGDQTPIKWRQSGRVNLSTEDLHDTFRDVLESKGWPVIGSTENLFDGYDVSGADLLIAAKIVDLKMNLCYPLTGWGNFTDAKGSASMEVEWQIYNPMRKEIIGKIITKGSDETEKNSDDASIVVFENAFSMSANNLLASTEFFSLLKKAEGLRKLPKASGYKLISNPKVKNNLTTEQVLNLARNSTVTIRTPIGIGSGFSIGNGDLIITNEHVVKNSKNVTLVTNNKIELSAKVIKKNKERDVALIQLDNGIKIPSLNIKTTIPLVGTKVFAIGTPRKEQLMGTVTSGIISSERVLDDGLNYLQSDVSINPGNSGGPLLDETGSVIGISVAGFLDSQGLNLMIPIEEALSYLELKLKK